MESVLAQLAVRIGGTRPYSLHWTRWTVHLMNQYSELGLSRTLLANPSVPADETQSPLLPVNSSQQEYCITNDGEVLLVGDSWKANACTSCTCNNGTIQCFSQSCPPANCRVPVLRKGQCCPHCLGECLNRRQSLPFVRRGQTRPLAAPFSENGLFASAHSHISCPRLNNAFFMAARDVESSMSAFPTVKHRSAPSHCPR